MAARRRHRHDPAADGLMAEGDDSRTEAATPARLTRAQSEGHAPVSHELASFANLGAAILIIMIYAPQLGRKTALRLGALLADAGSIDSPAALMTVLHDCAQIAANAVLPLMLAVVVTGAAIVLIQTRLSLRLSAFAPDLSRINPVAGLGKLFSANHAVDALKSVLKIAVMSAALWFVLSAQLRHLPDSLRENLGVTPSIIKTGIAGVAAALMVVQGFVAVLDVAWSQMSFANSVRMSRQDVKQETKDSEGNPQIKAKLKAIRNARTRQNLKKAMASATVVVTNPTHYAVALAYDRNSQAAPKLVAKGMGDVAARIRELALESRVPLIPNPPLARALHQLEIESEIPVEHYKAVADIIAYIWRLEAQAQRARMI
jgi:flagellar biosynthetic protein FlhB